MGAIAGEELLKWEKMQGVSGREEKILVSIRLRPLNEKEIAANESADWECINDTTILYRNTLREGSTFPSAYTFDKVFRGDCATRQVYEEGAKEVALSVVGGINSSIFAYGQTSSGKTYTMVGITEYAVADIFDYIKRHEERAFILKFSAIEIYNEIVRDLLSTDNTPLRLRDDPERGPILEKLTEETLRDWGHLKELIAFSEAQRQVGETYLNEKSSRSHQIIRLTMESSAREFLGKGNSATLVASVNFVDLAGSERASQASSAGMRLKEGCHINRSLLTLGTVIRKLSNGRHGHINYRDSKLTRILQPCLGGNARTAIICTLSPARSHVDQTRNTLLFACCAKEVTTKAQVNVVMSDKALVKHLQKEVARLESELKTPGPVTANCDYATLLRKKDIQIEKMEKEIRELTKQRDLAQSRVEDLLRMVGKEQISEKEGEDIWDDDCSVSESSSICGPHRPNTHIREFNNPRYNDGDSGSNPDGRKRNVKDVGVDPMLETPGTPLDWSLQFMSQQKEIIELWQSCCVPLTHRTYFFLLFRGDPTDSIYMEVELRRLSFLKETFSDGNQSVRNSQTITLASSVKALRRERGMLVKLIQRRLSDKERIRLYEEWGISLDSKRRRMQLVNRLWSENDINHVMQSATIVAKLVRFWERGKALKEMFGLSFSPLITGRRSSFSWKNSSASLL
ncbi:hypothetical protein LR48_Vigan08g177600 [Vigna angularis]|uniref:Kinesin-like protein n=1 Tax=Phaseolus angularis TaxID=3914 RepID=A0A0L9V8I6_PHAAN|nr:hypothetical protein LR48_Vigan08g177600 [Vigna angularis]